MGGFQNLFNHKTQTAQNQHLAAKSLLSGYLHTFDTYQKYRVYYLESDVQGVTSFKKINDRIYVFQESSLLESMIYDMHLSTYEHPTFYVDFFPFILSSICSYSGLQT